MIVDTNNTFSFQIPTENMPKFRGAFEKLSRKSEKLLGKPFTLELGETETVVFQVNPYQKQAVMVRNITIIGATIPIIDGWEFAASIVHQIDDSGKMINVIKSILSEDFSFPKEYRSEKPQCNHCGINRFRKHSFIVYNATTQEFKQVGKQCLRDYTGNKDILQIASLLENLLRVKDEFGFNEIGGGYRGHDVFGISAFLSITLACIRAFGYVSSKDARETSETATKEHVMRYMNLIGKPKSMYDTEFCSEVEKFVYSEDQGKIDTIIDHFQFEDKDPENLNDYEYNCYAVCQSGVVFSKTAGICVSMVGSYEKNINSQRANSLKANSTYLGSLKDKVRLEVEVLNSFSFQTPYGTTFNVFMLVNKATLIAGKGKKITYTDIPVNNNVVCWQTGGGSADLNILLRAINSNKPVQISGGIKKHDNYKNSGDVTYLERCYAKFLDGTE